MKKIIGSLFLLSVLTACNNSDKITCGDYEISISQKEKSLDVVINGDPVTLQQAISASGVRYEGVLNDTNIVLWNKGSDWTLYLNDELPIECE